MKCKNQNGLNLIELLLVLGIVALLLIAAFVVYPRVQIEQEANEQAGKWSLVQGKIHSTFSGMNYYGFDRNSIIASNILSEETLTSKWGVIDFAATYPSGYGCASSSKCITYTLVYMGVEPQFCVKFLSRIENTAARIRVQGAENVIVKGAPVSNSPAGTLDAEYSPALMVSACNAVDANGSVSLWLTSTP